MDRSKWRKLIKDVRWSGWVWVGECFFCYRPTRVVPDQRPLNDCVCVWKGLYAEVIVYKQWEIDEHEVACVYRDKYQVHV